MLDGIAAAEILRGVRGAQPVDREALATMIVNVSQLVADFPEISELDLNPVFATPQSATAADVRVVLDLSLIHISTAVRDCTWRSASSARFISATVVAAGKKYSPPCRTACSTCVA